MRPPKPARPTTLVVPSDILIQLPHDLNNRLAALFRRGRDFERNGEWYWEGEFWPGYERELPALEVELARVLAAAPRCPRCGRLVAPLRKAEVERKGRCYRTVCEPPSLPVRVDE